MIILIRRFILSSTKKLSFPLPEHLPVLMRKDWEREIQRELHFRSMARCCPLKRGALGEEAVECVSCVRPPSPDLSVKPQKHAPGVHFAHQHLFHAKAPLSSPAEYLCCLYVAKELGVAGRRPTSLLQCANPPDSANEREAEVAVTEGACLFINRFLFRTLERGAGDSMP